MFRRQLVFVLLGIVAVTAGLAGVAVAGKGNGNNKTFEYTIGLWGDLPYSAAQPRIPTQEDPGIPNLIADMNNSDIQFSVNDGDLKAGNGITTPPTPPSSFRDDPLYERALGWLNALDQPAIFTPGDNDWTDCDRTSNGAVPSLERLDHERELFFSTSYSLGKQTLKQEVQSEPMCLGYVSGGLPTNNPSHVVTRPVPCVENRRWEFHGVMYVTVNVQGTCNNLCSSGSGDAPATDIHPRLPAPQSAPDRLPEYTARNAADAACLRQSSAEAKANGAAGILTTGQADPAFDRSGEPYSPPFQLDPSQPVPAPDAPT